MKILTYGILVILNILVIVGCGRATSPAATSGTPNVTKPFKLVVWNRHNVPMSATYDAECTVKFDNVTVGYFWNNTEYNTIELSTAPTYDLEITCYKRSTPMVINDYTVTMYMYKNGTIFNTTNANGGGYYIWGNIN